MSFGFGVGDFLAVTKLANDIWQRLHDSVDQFAAIRNEVAGLSSLLDEVSKTVSKQNLAPKQAQGLAASGNACRSVLEDLQKLVDKYGGFTNEARGLTAKIRQTNGKLKWSQDDARDLRARITSTITVLRALSESLARDEQARRELCQWLSPLDFPTQQREVYSRRQEGSGKWLLESETFKRWLKTEGGVLLCPGNPGAGKTVLASIVIDHLWNKVRTDDIGVAYIYCDYLKYREQTPVHLVGSLLKQLAEQQNPISESLKSYYDEHKGSNTDPNAKQAFEVLKAECDSWSRIFIIVDALDECSEKDSTRQAVIKGLLALQGSKRINILVTSRPIPSILCDFEVSERLDIRANSADIETYLLGQMDRFPKRILAEKDLGAKIISEIVDAADGMFLLARLTLDALVGHKTLKAIKGTLEKLSRGSTSLDSAYDDAMKRIEDQHPDDRDLAKKTLLWISQGQRLLSVAEMQQAVAIELGESDLDPDSTVDCDDIISACTGLVTRDSDIEVSTYDRHYGQPRTRRRDILRLVHYTTKEYLERTEMKYFPKAQEYLASSCLTYLLFDVFSGALCSQSDASEDRVWHETKEFLCFGCKKCWTAEKHESNKNPGDFLQVECWNARDKEYPFYAYAAWYWGNHIENCDDEATRILTERFLNDHKRVSGALYFVRQNYTDLSWPATLKLEDSNPGSATQVAAFLGVTKIMFERLENESEPDVEDWSGATPLFWAAYRGHEDIVRLLMTHEDVNPNVGGRYGRTPLMIAVQNQHIAIVQRLLAYEYIDINAKDCSDWSALIYAIQLGQDCMLISKLLLACDNINVNLKDYRGQTPLMFAVEYEQGETFRLLLARSDIQVNTRDKEGRTALHIAAEGDYVAALQLLLAHDDIQANTRDKAGQSALHVVARHAKAEAMQLLLAHGDIQVNIRDDNGSTALHVAVEQLEFQWEVEVLQLLLARDDLEVNATDDHGESALFGAVRNAPDTPCLDVAELFLARGDVDVNIRDSRGKTPLYHAILSRQPDAPDVVQLLLTREDLQINVEDGEEERLVSLAEDKRDRAKNEARKSNANAIVNLLRSYFQQRSSNTTSANLGKQIPQRLAHIADDNNNTAAHGTDNIQIIEEQIPDLAVGDSPLSYEE